MLQSLKRWGLWIWRGGRDVERSTGKVLSLNTTSQTYICSLSVNCVLQVFLETVSHDKQIICCWRAISATWPLLWQVCFTLIYAHNCINFVFKFAAAKMGERTAALGTQLIQCVADAETQTAAVALLTRTNLELPCGSGPGAEAEEGGKFEAQIQRPTQQQILLKITKGKSDLYHQIGGQFFAQPPVIMALFKKMTPLLTWFLIDWRSEQFLDGFMVSTASFKSSSEQHDVHFFF